jgi:hypothetical protein
LGASGAGTYRNLAADIAQFTLFDAADKVVFTLDPAEHRTGSSWKTLTGHTVSLSGGASIATDSA